MPSLDARLAAAAAELGVALTPEASARLLQFLGLLGRWNATYNLTAVRDSGQMLTHHLVDCLAAVAAYERRMGPAPRRVLDVGSGGGLPGVALAVLRPQDRVVCVDAVGKKVAFIRQVALELGLANLGGEHARVEALRIEPVDVVTSRAFASLADFTRLTRQHLARGGLWMAMKGRAPDAEIAELPANVVVFHVEQLHVPGLDAERCIVWMRPLEDH